MKVRKITVSEVCKLNQNSLCKDDNFDIIEYLDTGSITRNKIESTQILKVCEDEIPSRARRKVKDNSIIYSTVRPNQEHFGFLRNPRNNFIVSTGFTTIDVTDVDVDSKYLYYAITQKHITDYLHSIGENSVSSYPSINPSDLGNLSFSIPKQKDDQVKIATVLTALDEKIEINNQINTELEAMAKTLFDYWFVQFDFPDANGKPYKSSGGRLLYNPTLKREIPEGWEAKNMLKVANLLGGGTPTKTKPEFWNGEIPFFTPSDSDSSVYSLKTEDYITQEGLENSSTKLFPRNTVFVTARGSVGRLALNAVPMAMNQSCYALQAKESISYAYLFFLTKELIRHLEVKASGSVFNSIVSNDIEYTNLAIPDTDEVIKAYAKIVEPLFEKIEINIKENSQLEGLRDWLLPMLMNGQVTVKQ